MEKPKYNYDKLRGLIKEFFGTQANFASAMRMGTTTLTQKLNGETYFTQPEIELASQLLQLNTAEEVNVVFFTHK